MKATRVWAALALAGLLMAGCQSSPSGGEGGTGAPPAATSGGDLKAMGAAMAKATSWHITHKMPEGETELDIVCPDKMKSVSKVGKMTVEAIRIGNDTFTKVGKSWVKTTAPADSPLCGAGSSYAASTPSAFAKVTKGGTATVNGESCQEWTIESSLGSSTMCVGSDNLPRQTKRGDTTITYSNWNKPVTIEAPK
ncbi:MAG: hypothetical protein ACRD24_06075 [Terriglobales bacterium]